MSGAIRALAVAVCGLVAALVPVAASAQTPTTSSPATSTPGSATDTPSPNPARPTVSTPATLTPVGYLQFENGIFLGRTSGDFTSQVSVNQVTKLTVTDRLQFIVQMEPYAHTRQDGAGSNDFGGVGAGVQGVLFKGDGATPTIAVSYLRPVAGGTAADIDIGSSDQSASLLVSADFGAFHVDTNAIFNQQSNEALKAWQNGETLSVAHPAGTATLAVEVWRFSQPLQNASCAGFLVAVSHPVGKTIVVDGGFNRGLTETSTRWEVFGGFTYLLPKRLW
jgi:hypothetical protein